MIRLLTLPQDRATVFTLLEACADYVWLEREETPLPCLVDEYFSDAPPGIDPADGHRPGLFDSDRLLALAEMSFGFPAPDAAYLGLMIVHPVARGAGAGPRLLHHLEAVARSRGSRRMFLGALNANPRGRAFWQREGFVPTGLEYDVTLGQKTQLAHRFAKPL